MSALRAQVVNMIANGSSKQEILQLTEIAPEQLGEWLADKEFTAEVRQAKELVIEQQIERTSQDLELRTIKKIKENMDYYSAGELCRVLDTVVRAKQMRRTLTVVPANGHFNNPTVGLSVTVPIFLGNSQVVLDSNKQVVAIGDRNMAPLPSDQVHNLFKQLEYAEKEKGNSHEDPILADLAATKAADSANRAEAEAA